MSVIKNIIPIKYSIIPMNNNTPVKETSPDVIFAFLIFLVCVFISLFFDPDSLAATFVFMK